MMWIGPGGSCPPSRKVRRNCMIAPRGPLCRAPGSRHGARDRAVVAPDRIDRRSVIIWRVADGAEPMRITPWLPLLEKGRAGGRWFFGEVSPSGRIRILRGAGVDIGDAGASAETNQPFL